MKHIGFEQGSPRRRGIVIVLTVVTLVVILGFAALTIDVGAMYNARADLQRAADAGALACAAELSRATGGSSVERARALAQEVVAKNPVLGRKVVIDVDRDLEIGRAEVDERTGAIKFVATSTRPDAARVTVRRTEDSPNGPMPTYFAQIFGKKFVNISASAVAFLAPRDIALVADLSGSMNDDSELKHCKLTEINLWDVWRALPAKRALPGEHPTWMDLDASPPMDEAVAFLDPDDPTITLYDLPGPAWGFMKGLGFGTDLDPDTYDPATDDGLVRLKKSSNWNVAALTSYLQSRQYSSAEVSAINSSSYDSNYYANRVAVALGLAFWNSGKSGGQWSTRGGTKGNGDDKIDSSELEWAQPLLGNSVANSTSIWKNYVSYVANSQSSMNDAGVSFQYRYGVKTLTNYLLDVRYSNDDTPELSGTPEQPMQAVKDATEYMLNLFADLETNDLVSLEIYGTTAHHREDLTDEFLEVNNEVNEVQAGHIDPWTNMGGGLGKAIDELLSARARGLSQKVLVLLTDGNANVNESGKTGDDAGGKAYALKEARRAASLGITIFAVSVGAAADQDVMQEIADITGGAHFHAEGSIDQYSDQLLAIFGEIGRRRAVELIQ